MKITLRQLRSLMREAVIDGIGVDPQLGNIKFTSSEHWPQPGGGKLPPVYKLKAMGDLGPGVSEAELDINKIEYIEGTDEALIDATASGMASGVLPFTKDIKDSLSRNQIDTILGAVLSDEDIFEYEFDNETEGMSGTVRGEKVVSESSLRMLIIEEILSETGPAGGFRSGDQVYHRRDRQRGKGTVVGRYKDIRMGHIFLVKWEDGSQQRHIPSELSTQPSPIRSNQPRPSLTGAQEFIDKFKKPLSPELYSGSSADDYAREGDDLHADIVSSVFEDVKDTALINAGKDRVNVVLNGIDIEMERREFNNEEVDFSEINLQQVFEDVMFDINAAESHQETKRAASEQGPPGQDVEDEFEAFLWSKGAKPKTVSEIYAANVGEDDREIGGAQTSYVYTESGDEETEERRGGEGSIHWVDVVTPLKQIRDLVGEENRDSIRTIGQAISERDPTGILKKAWDSGEIIGHYGPDELSKEFSTALLRSLGTALKDASQQVDIFTDYWKDDVAAGFRKAGDAMIEKAEEG